MDIYCRVFPQYDNCISLVGEAVRLLWYGVLNMILKQEQALILPWCSFLIQTEDSNLTKQKGSKSVFDLGSLWKKFILLWDLRFNQGVFNFWWEINSLPLPQYIKNLAEKSSSLKYSRMSNL